MGRRVCIEFLTEEDARDNEVRMWGQKGWKKTLGKLYWGGESFHGTLVEGKGKKGGKGPRDKFHLKKLPRTVRKGKMMSTDTECSPAEKRDFKKQQLSEEEI